MKTFKTLRQNTPSEQQDDYESDEGIQKAFARHHAANKKELAKHGVTKGFKESTWQTYRQEALLEAALDKPTLTPNAIAKKHGVSVESIEAQLKKGIDVEKEHTSDASAAREIALDHLGEFADYYTKLKKVEGAIKEGFKQYLGYSKAMVGDDSDHKAVEDVAKHHGYKFSHHTAGGDYVYKHPQGHKIVERDDPDGHWAHYGPTKHAGQASPFFSGGWGGRDLHKHLSMIHKKLEEGLTPRERLSGAERLAPIKPAPLDHAQDQKQALAHHDNTNDSMRKNMAQGGLDSSAHKTIHHATASKTLKLKEAYGITFNEGGPEYKVGDKVHVGVGTKGGVGYVGTLHKMDDREVHVKIGTDKYGDRIIRAPHRLVSLHEDATGAHKVGDKVVPKIGPHKGTVHTVIHVHPTGHLNIKPDVHVRSNRYHLGAAKADPKDVTRHLAEGSSEGMTFHKALAHAKKHGHRVTYGTASRKWHTIDSQDRDYHTSFALDPDEARRQGEAKSLLSSTSARRLEENLSPEHINYMMAKAEHPKEYAAAKKKASKKWGPWGSWGTKGMDFHYPQSPTGINRKTVQEAFQAAKDKKNGKKDALPDEGANEPNKDVQAPPPQGQPATQDGGAPEAKKKNNTPVPEKQGRGKKIEVKGPGVEDKFQPDPIVTPLTTMPDVASPKNGSQGVR